MQTAPQTYEPRDLLWLWWLSEPAEPTLVGELSFVRARRGVSLRYADSWVANGFALSEDLPLVRGQEFLPEQRDTAVGAIDDARPDRWGERVIRFVDRPPRLSLMEYLYFAGDDRFGALGVSTHPDTYQPRRLGPLPTLADVDAVHRLVEKVLANEPIADAERRLVSPGATMGGARPKALVELGGQRWVVKFSAGDPIDAPLVEHASMTLASTVGICVADTRPIRLTLGHAVAIRRFDRQKDRRLHALSAHVALRAAQEEMGYPELAQLLRRRGAVAGQRYKSQMQELFRRMVFNILIDNTDDHEKNHAVLVNDANQYELSPAYHVLPSGQALGYQQMRMGRHGNDATLDNALSECGLFALKPKQAHEQARQVAAVVDDWKKHFRAVGVTKGDIELLAEQIDRPFLREQRAAMLASKSS